MSVREDIMNQFHKKLYRGYNAFNDMLTLCANAEHIAPYDHPDFDMVIFSVDKKWLYKHLNEIHKNKFRSENGLQRWMQLNFTSDDAAVIFYDALDARKLAAITFQ